MVSANTLCKKLLNVKNAVIESADFYSDQDDVKHVLIHARPNKYIDLILNNYIGYELKYGN